MLSLLGVQNMIMRFLFCISFLFLPNAPAFASSGARLVSPKLLQEFFKFKNIKAIHLQTCNYVHSLLILKALANEFIVTISMKSNRTSTDKLQRERFRRHHRIGVFVDLTCMSNLDFLRLATSQNMFGISNEWLLWLNKKEDISMLEDTGIQICSQVTTVVAAADLYDLYRPDINVNLIITNVGSWNDLTGLHYRRAPRVYDFQRSALYGSIYFYKGIFDRQNFSAQFQDRSFQPNMDIANRFFYTINLHVADLYNYTLKLVETDDWGEIQPDGHFNGMMGQLETKVTNISVGPLLMIPARSKVAYSMPLPLETGVPFVFRQPRALGTYRALSLPLMPATWIVVAIILLLATCILYRFRTKDGHTINFSESLVLFIGIFSQQGLSNDPGTMSGRMLCLSILLTAVIVVLHYNAATMTALLSSTPPKIRTLEQLIFSKVPLTLIEDPFFKSNETLVRVFGKSIIEKKDLFHKRRCTLEEGLQVVLEGGAFSAEFFVLYEAIDKSFKDSQKCDLTFVWASLQLLLKPFIPIDSPLRELYMRGFIRLMENGQARREKNRWIARKPKCSGKKQFLFVTLEAITIALAIFWAGVIISVNILLIEIIVNSRKKHRKQLKQEITKRNSTSPFILPVID